MPARDSPVVSIRRREKSVIFQSPVQGSEELNRSRGEASNGPAKVRMPRDRRAGPDERYQCRRTYPVRFARGWRKRIEFIKMSLVRDEVVYEMTRAGQAVSVRYVGIDPGRSSPHSQDIDRAYWDSAAIDDKLFDPKIASLQGQREPAWRPRKSMDAARPRSWMCTRHGRPPMPS